MAPASQPPTVVPALFDPVAVDAAWAAALAEVPGLLGDPSPLSARLRHTHTVVKNEKSDAALGDFSAAMLVWAWRTRGDSPRAQQLDDWAASFMYYGGVPRAFGGAILAAAAELQARAEELDRGLTQLFPQPAREECLALLYAWWQRAVVAAESSTEVDALKTHALAQLRERCASLRREFGESERWRELRREMVFALADLAPPLDGTLPPAFADALSEHDAACSGEHKPGA